MCKSSNIRIYYFFSISLLFFKKINEDMLGFFLYILKCLSELASKDVVSPDLKIVTIALHYTLLPLLPSMYSL